jgi:diacylglycerol kinase (ATP)
MQNIQNKIPENTGLSKRIHSFVYAFKGIYYLLRNETNAQIHCVAAITAIVLGLVLRISTPEWCFIIFAIGIVLSAESFNTAIEKLVDHLFPQYHETAKIAKDVAAGAVLLCAIAALIVGIVIFLPKILVLLNI